MKLFDELAERVEELERGLDAANQRTSKQHYALEKRYYALTERMAQLEEYAAQLNLTLHHGRLVRLDMMSKRIDDNKAELGATWRAMPLEHLQRHVELGDEIKDLYSKVAELEREVADHETRITHQAADQAEYLGCLAALETLARDLYGIYEAREERLDVMGRRIRELERLVGWYAGYPRRVDREAGATASRPAWERDLEQHVDITGAPKDSTEKRG